MVWIISFFTILGINFAFWLCVSLLRLLSEKVFKWPKPPKLIEPAKLTLNDVAAIIPAHNEQRTIKRTLKALLKIFPQNHIYVASDYSTDKTIQIVRSLGVRLLDIKPNRGKARSLVYIMQEYRLLQRYKLILINDSDTEIEKEYINRALPYFDDPDISCIATHGVSRMEKYNFLQKFFIAYRIRLWRIIQFGMRFGQTWRYSNMSFIVPGSLSLYRSSVLKKLEIDAPGLIIEDFNMTFELHKKKLGKIAYNPNMVGVHQDPFNLHDYIKQVERWNIGFFQTVKRHGIWMSPFWFFTTAYYLELYLFAFFILLVPVYLWLFIINSFDPISIPYIYQQVTILDLFIGVFLIDYLMTVVAAIFEKKPILLLYGLGFFFLRYIDAFIYLGSPVVAFFSKSSGVWKSPKRM